MAIVTLFEKFASWLSSYLNSFLFKLKVAAISIIQLLIDSFVNVVTWIIGMFPNGDAIPSLSSTPVGEVFTITMQTLNWIFPIAFLSQVALWLGAVYLAYLCLAPIARWAKLLT